MSSLPAPTHQSLKLHPEFGSWGALAQALVCEVTSRGYLRKGLAQKVGKKTSAWQPWQGARGLNQWYRKARSVHVKE